MEPRIARMTRMGRGSSDPIWLICVGLRPSAVLTLVVGGAGTPTDQNHRGTEAQRGRELSGYSVSPCLSGSLLGELGPASVVQGHRVS